VRIVCESCQSGSSDARSSERRPRPFRAIISCHWMAVDYIYDAGFVCVDFEGILCVSLGGDYCRWLVGLRHGLDLVFKFI